MDFYFRDKTEFEYNIIVDILRDNSIMYKTSKNNERVYVQCEYDDDYCEMFFPTYDISINTSLEMFDYIKFLVDKKIKQIISLNNCLMKKISKRKVKKHV